MPEPDSIYRFIAKRKVATVADLAELGLSRSALFRALAMLLDDGRLVRVRRGVYQVTKNRDASDTWGQVMQR